MIGNQAPTGPPPQPFSLSEEPGVCDPGTLCAAEGDLRRAKRSISPVGYRVALASQCAHFLRGLPAFCSGVRKTLTHRRTQSRNGPEGMSCCLGSLLPRFSIFLSSSPPHSLIPPLSLTIYIYPFVSPPTSVIPSPSLYPFSSGSSSHPHLALFNISVYPSCVLVYII